VDIVLPLSEGETIFSVYAKNVLGNTGEDSLTISAHIDYTFAPAADGPIGVGTLSAASLSDPATADKAEAEAREYVIEGATISDENLQIRNNSGSDGGSANVLRVLAGDSDLATAALAASARRIIINDQPFEMELSGNNLTLDRPILPVFTGAPALSRNKNIKNVIDAFKLTSVVMKIDRFIHTVDIAMTLPMRPRYASGTQVEFVVGSPEFKRFTVESLAEAPILKKRYGFSLANGEEVDQDSDIKILSWNFTAPDQYALLSPGKRVLKLILQIHPAFHRELPILGLDIKIKGRNKPLKLKNLFRVVPLKVVVCAIDGGGCAGISGAIATGRAKHFSRVFAGHGIKALAAFPTVTFCNWPGVFSGQPPKDTGILGNSYFARDQASVGTEPFLSANKPYPTLEGDPLW
jgi:hypothetical protein